MEKTIEETHPTFEKIIFFCKPINEQLFSWRNGYQNVIPEEVVINYLQKHTIDKSVLLEFLNKIIKESEEPYATDWVEGYIDKIKKELGLEEENDKDNKQKRI